MYVDQESLKQLGWADILTVLGGVIQTDRGRKHVESLVPCTELREVEWRFAIQAELHWLSETESLTLDISGATEVGPLVRRAEKGGLLEGLEVRACARVLETFQAVKSIGERWVEHMPNVAALAGELGSTKATTIFRGGEDCSSRHSTP